MPLHVVMSEMPFPKTCRRIPLRLEQRRHRHPTGFDKVPAVPPVDAFLQGAAPIVAAGENTVAGGRTDCGGSVGVREDHPFRSQLVETIRMNSGGRIQAGQVTVTHVIRQDIDDIG